MHSIANDSLEQVTATTAPSTLEFVPEERIDQILDTLRHHGGRITGSRRLVIEALLEHHSHHVTAADVVTAIRRVDPEFYESTVYRTLDRLVELAVVDRVQLGPGAAVYHLPHRAHLHLVCEQCGVVIEAASDLLDGVATQVRARLGFVLDPVVSTLSGTCPSCSVERATASR